MKPASNLSSKLAAIDNSSGAAFSTSRTYRYAIWRNWDRNKPKVLFVGLNPSTADENKNDPTIRRCISFAESWGYGGVVICNLFAYRATQPEDMKKAARPVGPENSQWLDSMTGNVEKVLVCWGNHGNHKSQDEKFIQRYADLFCLAVNATGAPVHPLYQPGSAVPRYYHPPENPSRSNRMTTALSRPS